MPASSPLSASFIAESVVSFGKVIVVISPNIYISDYYNVGGCALFCATTTISVGKDTAFYLKHKIILVLFVCMDCKNCVSFHNTTQGRCLFCFFQDKKGNVRAMRECVVISCASACYGAAIARGRGGGGGVSAGGRRHTALHPLHHRLYALYGISSAPAV